MREVHLFFWSHHIPTIGTIVDILRKKSVIIFSIPRKFSENNLFFHRKHSNFVPKSKKLCDIYTSMMIGGNSITTASR